MALFSRKSKSKKADKADDKKSEPEDKPKAEPYRHVPKHAASDSVAGGKKGEAAQDSIAAESYKRRQNPAKRIDFINHAKSNAINQQTGHGGTSTPNHLSYSSRTGSYEVFNSISDAPAFPQSPGVGKSAYPAPSFDSPVLNNPKMQAAARDRGYLNPAASDSGYGSAHTSQPNSVITPAFAASFDTPSLPLLRRNSSLLPKLSLSEELAQDPAFSEHSFTEDTHTSVTSSSDPSSTFEKQRPLEMARQRPNSTNTAMSGPRPALNADSRPKSTKSIKSAMKQTRFDVPHDEPTGHIQQDWALNQSSTLAQPLVQQGAKAQAPLVQNTDPHSLPSRHEQSYSQSSNQLPVLGRVTSRGSQRTRTTVLSLTVLEGLKVNKRGRILDEEGDPIGELVEGDLIDCVRQKCNGFGEVLDEYGAVVGRVRTLPRGIERTLSPAPLLQQQTDYFQGTPQVSSNGAAVSPNLPIERPKSSPAYYSEQPYSYQPSQYTWPTQQYTVPFSKPEDLQIAQPQPRLPPVAPIDAQPGAMELDGTEEAEVGPIMDLSDVFIPPSSAVPRVPSRSPLRPATPSSTNSKTAGKARSLRSAGSSRSSSETEQASRPTQLQPSVDSPASQPAEAKAPSKPSEVQPPPSIARRWINSQSLLRSRSESKPQSQSTDIQLQTSGGVQRPQPPATPPPESLPVENKSPFAYKGAIPPPESSAFPAAKHPPMPSIPRQPSNGHIQGIAPFNPLHLPSLTGGNIPNPAKRATSVHGQAMKPAVKGRYSQTSPMVRSPLSSHGTTPPASDQGYSEEGRFTPMPQQPQQQQPTHLYPTQQGGRAPSIHSNTASVRTAPDKSRNYFSHARKASLDSGRRPSTQQGAQHVKRFSTPQTEKKVEKRKSRFSFLSKSKS